MKRIIKLFSFLGMLTLVTVSCSVVSNESKILFQDDFSDPATGWDSFSNIDGATDYFNGGYRISANLESFYSWSNPGLTTDVIVTVDATKTLGGDDNQFGILCRHLDTENFYALLISSDGFYSISKRFNGSDLEFIGAENWLQSDSINQGKALNQIRAECIGNQISLYTNGQLLLQVIDSDIKFGDVGLLGGTVGDPSTVIIFDNFEVRLP